MQKDEVRFKLDFCKYLGALSEELIIMYIYNFQSNRNKLSTFNCAKIILIYKSVTNMGQIQYLIYDAVIKYAYNEISHIPRSNLDFLLSRLETKVTKL